MIVRMWHGRVASAKAKAYREFTSQRAIPDYQSVPGNISAYVLVCTTTAFSSFSTVWVLKQLCKTADNPALLVGDQLGMEEKMKKLIMAVTVLGALGLMAGGKTSDTDLGLPALNVINEIALGPSYSCRPEGESKEGYAGTALFLSDYAKHMNSPDLLFNGACNAVNYFEASTAGDDMSLIADLGNKISLEGVSAHRAFNLEGVHSFPAYSKFARAVEVEAHHTYAVLLNGRTKRGLFVFAVDEYIPNQRVKIRYAVQSYQLTLGGQVVSPGFEWEKKNARQ